MHVFLITLGAPGGEVGVESTGGLSAGRSLALGSSVWADRKEQLRCRAGQGQVGAGIQPVSWPPSQASWCRGEPAGRKGLVSARC